MTDGDLNAPQEPRRNNTFKWIALGCGGCLGLAVLLSVLVGVFVSRTLDFALEPEDVETQGQDLFTYTLPGGSEGVLSIELFGLQITQVTSPEDPPSAVLTLGKVPNYMRPGLEPETFSETLQEQITLEGSYQLIEQRLEKRRLCGQTVPILIQAGTYQNDQTQSDAASYFALVEYSGITRFAWILAQGDTPQQTADQVFDSLVCQ